MTEAEFNDIAERVLEQVRRALEASASEVFVEEKGDGVIELEFVDGSKMVINRHGAAQEIWVAARAGGFHFRWADNAWRDTREGTELFASLSKLVSAQGGTPVVLAPPRAG
jgi:CyaY protein